MAKKKAEYSSCKILVRVWHLENTKEVYENKIMIDLEDIEQVEEYVDIDNVFKGEGDLTTLKSYWGREVVVKGSFGLLAGLVKEAKVRSSKKNGQVFFNN